MGVKKQTMKGCKCSKEILFLTKIQERNSECIGKLHSIFFTDFKL